MRRLSLLPVLLVIICIFPSLGMAEEVKKVDVTEKVEKQEEPGEVEVDEVTIEKAWQPILQVEFGFFIPEMDSSARFRGGETSFNFQDDFKTEEFSTLGYGKVEFFSGPTRLNFTYYRGTFREEGATLTNSFFIGGQNYNSGESVDSSETIERLGFNLYYSLLPTILQGLQLDIFFNAQYLINERRVSSRTTGASSRSMVNVLIPNGGLYFELSLLYTNPPANDISIRPRSYFSLFFQIQGVAMLEYASRDIKKYFEFEGGVKIKPAFFFHLTLSYRLWTAEVSDIDTDERIDFFMDGFSLAFILRF